MPAAGETLPWPYIVKGCRNKLNGLCQVEMIRTDEISGVEYDFREMLVDEVRDILSLEGITGEGGGAPVEELQVESRW